MNTNMTNESIATKVPQISVKRYNTILSSNNIYIKVKRIIDVVFALIALIILLPVFAIIALAIKIESKGPVFFKHTRIGKNGKIIKIYKFRSMVNNAEELIKNFTPEQMKEYKENYKLSNDPRITRVGKILRRASLDELPQLINIIKGDLSIIGPRPVVQEELKKYGDNAGKFLSITPGLTGYWAANGRSCTSYQQRMEMELFYVENVSLKLDLQIFLKTFEAVINRRGAV